MNLHTARITFFTLLSLGIFVPAYGEDLNPPGDDLSYPYGGPNPNEIYITDYATDGIGCPEGSVDMVLTPDGRSLSILFEEFFVETPTHEPGPPPGWGQPFSLPHRAK